MAALSLLRRAASSRRMMLPLRAAAANPLCHRHCFGPHFSAPVSRLSRSPSAASRGFCAAAKDSSLVAALRDEIEHEKELDVIAEGEKKQPPAPFTIVDKPGMDEVYLHRSYEGEDISVACLFQSSSEVNKDDEEENMEEEEEEEEGAGSGQSAMVQLTVKVSKGGDSPYIEFGCSSYGDQPLVDRVSFKESCDVADLPYEGPDFMSLDEKVKDGFHKFLRDRGINARLGEYLLQYMYHKEQREYSRWLKRVESFISK